ncbi:MAG: GNAT family N-acetyltransferase [Armatimonadota bacterium]|nr:GNAT family N-acetyltransferase [Armatimonadota bacterium]
MRVRDADRADLARIVDAWGELARLHERTHPAFALSQTWRRAYEEYLAALLGREDTLVVVAESGGQLAGVAIGRITTLPPFFRHRRRGFIQDVYTREGYRRRGVGRRMIERIEQWLRDRGIRRAELTVAVPNREAEAFWERMGYRTYMVHRTKEL